jgi:hypothetical protein
VYDMNHTIMAMVAASIALAVAWTIGAIDHVPIQAYAVSSARVGQTADQTQQLQGSAPIRLTGPSSNTEMSNSNPGTNNNAGVSSDPGTNNNAGVSSDPGTNNNAGANSNLGQQGPMAPQPPANPTIDPEAQGPIGQMMNGLMSNALSDDK